MIRTPLAACCVAICLTGAVACHGGGQAAAPPAVVRSGHAATDVSPSRPAGAPATPGVLAAPGRASRASSGPATAPTQRKTPRTTPTGCGTGPARRAWAMDLGMTGVPLWDQGLPTDPTQSGVAVQPLVLGAAAVFAEENGVYALRVSDGRVLWRRSFAVPRADLWSTMVYGMWGWRGTVAVLVGQAGPSARLISLDAATGAVRWTLPLSRHGVTGDLTPTGDGGLAMVLGDGSLAVADVATGSLRWSRPGAYSPTLVAVDGVVIVVAGANSSSSSSVAAYDATTGRQLWIRTGLPTQPQLQVAAERLLVYTNTQNVSPRPALWPVTALSPATGRTLWRAATAGPVSTLSAGPGGVAVSTADPDELYMLDPVTGRVRWHLATHADGSATPVVTGTDVVYVRDSGSGAALGGAALGGARLADLRASDGSARWAAPLAGSVFLPQPVLPFGPYMVVSLGSGQPGDPARLVAYQAANGAVAWTARVPALVQVPVAVAGRHLLVQPTDPAVACPAEGTAVRLFLAQHRLGLRQEPHPSARDPSSDSDQIPPGMPGMWVREDGGVIG